MYLPQWQRPSALCGRLTTGSQSAAGFTNALKSWLEWLDSKAFQLEQSAAQLITTGMLLFSGAITAFVVIAIFQFFAIIIEEAVLW